MMQTEVRRERLKKMLGAMPTEPSMPEPQMAKGGKVKDIVKGAITRAAEKAGIKAPVTANKDLTTMQDFRTSLGDRVRQGAADTQNMIESMPFKYDKGQRVFTDDSFKKNKPPYTILERTRYGNQVMRDTSGMKPRRDPDTGKVMRTPYEPGYKVRQGDGDDYMEFVIPESAIRGDVEMAKGGDAAKQQIKQALQDAIKSIREKLAKKAEKGKGPSIADDKTIKAEVNAAAKRIQKDSPKLSDADVAKRAERQALSKIQWEKSDKPDIEARYGLLEESRFDDPLSRRLRNIPAEVEKRAKAAEKFLAQPTERWTPPRPELQAFDRSMIKDALEGFPGIQQTRFPRYEAPRSDLSYIDEIYDDPRNRELIKKQITRGLPLGGETFYASLYPLKTAAMERGIAPEVFEQFVYQTAPASARNSIMNEMAVGQFLRDMNARGLPLDEDTVKREMARFKQQYGTGLPLMPVHREGSRQVIEGGLNMRDLLKADIPTNYKIPTYGTQKAGDFGKSMVLDVHESAGQTQGSRYHPYFTEQGGFGPAEYGPAESKMLGIAEEMGIPGGMAQAGRWFGGGELTGLKSPRGDALDLLERQAAYTMQGMGLKPTPRNIRNYILDMIETGEGVLMPYFKNAPMPDFRVEKKEGGAVQSGLSALQR